MMDIREKILSLIELPLAQRGFDVVDVHVSYRKKNDLVQVLVDKPLGGITIDECADASRMIDALLGQETFFDGSYMLEVSSPGIDRSLMTAKDFIRSQGKELVFYLKEPVEGSLEHTGVVVRVQGDHVVVRSKGKEINILIQLINKAKRVF